MNGWAEGEVKFSYWTLIVCSVFKQEPIFRPNSQARWEKVGPYVPIRKVSTTLQQVHMVDITFFFILQKDLKSLFIYLFNLIRICWRMNNTQILGRYWIKICIHPRYSLLFMPPASQPVSVSMFTHKESLLLVFFFKVNIASH